jgi:hypothetical protein
MSSPSNFSNGNSKIQQFNSPERPANVEVHNIIKSPQGYYSPKASSGNPNQQFRVFIQYKSPVKQI